MYILNFKNFDFTFKTNNNLYCKKLTTLPPKVLLNTLVTKKLNTKYLVMFKNSFFINLDTHLFTTNKINFKYLKHNLFNSFFSNSLVEIPKVLLNFKRLASPINQITIYKLTNYLTLHGKFIKSLIALNLAWNKSLQTFFQTTNYPLNWINTLYLLSRYKNTQKPTSLINLKQTYTRFIRNSYSIFTFYIYKINKNIYKNTRGKSGKFMFVWKYVPIYKRSSIITSWLVKELRVLPYRELKSRIMQLILKITQQPLKTWVFRVKTFSYNYVYYNCRKTLASTYKSNQT